MQPTIPSTKPKSNTSRTPTQRGLMPTRSQWARWSLPSRLTLIGTLVGIVGVLLSIGFYVWPLGTPTVAVREIPDLVSTGESREALDPRRAREAVALMTYESPENSPIRIISTTSPVKGLSAAAIEPPYREFPNVLLFQFNDGAQRWIRVLEGLSLGLQTDVSRVFDLHRRGDAIDLNMDESYTAEMREWFSPNARGRGWVPVQYDSFQHLHPSGHETYYLDKRRYTQLAKDLLIWRDSYPNTECTLFDVPELDQISLAYDAGRYTLTARTANEQQWTVTFTGIDGAGKLLDKAVSAVPTL